MDINIALPEYQTCERQSTVYNVTIDAEETKKKTVVQCPFKRQHIQNFKVGHFQWLFIAASMEKGN